jgi:hypothetical protein
MRMPNCGFLPHTSQTDAMTRNPCSYSLMDWTNGRG